MVLPTFVRVSKPGDAGVQGILDGSNTDGSYHLRTTGATSLEFNVDAMNISGSSDPNLKDTVITDLVGTLRQLKDEGWAHKSNMHADYIAKSAQLQAHQETATQNVAAFIGGTNTTLAQVKNEMTIVVQPKIETLESNATVSIASAESAFYNDMMDEIQGKMDELDALKYMQVESDFTVVLSEHEDAALVVQKAFDADVLDKDATLTTLKDREAAFGGDALAAGFSTHVEAIDNELAHILAGSSVSFDTFKEMEDAKAALTGDITADVTDVHAILDMMVAKFNALVPVPNPNAGEF